MSTLSISLAYPQDANAPQGSLVIIADCAQPNLVDTYQCLIEHNGIFVYFHKISLTTKRNVFCQEEDNIFLHRIYFSLESQLEDNEHFLIAFANQKLASSYACAAESELEHPQIELWAHYTDELLNVDFILQNVTAGAYDLETTTNQEGYYKTILVHNQKTHKNEWCSIC